MALANCAKMGLSMADARSLSWWEYQALVHHHQPEDAEDEVDAPDAAFVAERQQRLADKGLMRTIH